MVKFILNRLYYKCSAKENAPLKEKQLKINLG